MGVQMLIAVLVAISWIIAVCLGISMLAFAAMWVGHDYVFTTSGLFRSGPRIGSRIASAVWDIHGSRTSLQQILPANHLALLVFLGNLGERASGEDDELLSGLSRLIHSANNGLHLILFRTTSTSGLSPLVRDSRTCQIIELADNDFATKLGVRALPFGLLVDENGKVLAKGLVNHFEHLCLILMKGGRACSGRNEISSLLRGCAVHLQGMKDTNG